MFIILTHPRSGSELLTSALEAHPNLKVQSELLNPKRICDWRTNKLKELNITDLPFYEYFDFEENITVYHQTDRLANFIRDTFKTIDGFKLIHYQLEPISPVLEELKQNRKLKIIFLSRNYIESAISYWFAIKTKKWHIKMNEQQVEYNPSFIDPDFVTKFYKTAKTNKSFYMEQFSDHDKIEINYSDLIRKWDKTLQDIQRFLCVPETSLPMLLNKNINKPLRELVTNFDEIKSSCLQLL